MSGRGLCDELITRPEESYRLCCVVCDLETSRMGAPYIYNISRLRVKIAHVNNNNKNKWLTKGLTASRNRIGFFNRIRDLQIFHWNLCIILTDIRQFIKKNLQKKLERDNDRFI